MKFIPTACGDRWQAVQVQRVLERTGVQLSIP
jgi:hypothetical protein